MVNEIDKELAEYLGNDFESLSSEKQSLLSGIYKKRRKSDIIFFWWFLGFHYAYIGKWQLFFWFIISFGGLGFWWVIDLFRLIPILSEYNKKLAYKILEGLDLEYEKQ